jgi:hypothetical protein
LSYHIYDLVFEDQSSIMGPDVETIT